MQIPSISLICMDLYCSSKFSISLVRFRYGDKDDISFLSFDNIISRVPVNTYPAIEEDEDLAPYRPLM